MQYIVISIETKSPISDTINEFFNEIYLTKYWFIILTFVIYIQQYELHNPQFAT